MHCSEHGQTLASRHAENNCAKGTGIINESNLSVASKDASSVQVTPICASLDSIFSLVAFFLSAYGLKKNKTKTRGCIQYVMWIGFV